MAQLVEYGFEELLVETHWSHCVMSLNRTLICCLVLVRPRKTGNRPKIKYQHKQMNKTDYFLDMLDLR